MARLKVEGLREMILHRLNTLMPQQCKMCLKNYYLMIKEQAVVSCLRCIMPA